jgi:4'-phosphopantetheinyl transferase
MESIGYNMSVFIMILTHPRITLSCTLKAPEDMTAEKFRTSMIGYSLHYESSLCGMAMTQGVKEKVVTIGLGFKQYAVEPRGASIEAYVESCSHKASITEYSY